MRLTPDQRSTILAFMKKNAMAVIGTYDVKSGQPETALVAFAETEDLEIVFETFDVARKYENLRSHPKISLVIGWNLEEHVTLQYEGEAREAANEEEAKAWKTVMLRKKTPCTEIFLNDPHVRMFKARPTWIRLSDYSGDCTAIIEGRL